MVFQPIPREKVLAAIDRVGPVQPLDLVRALKEGDSVLLGAILSELAANQHVAISKTKRGGSPFYYLPAKPETLEAIAQFLKEKDRRTFAYLREQGVVREDALDPLTRVSLGNIPDFSRRFLVGDVAFWRYYLIPEDEAIKKAKERFGLLTKEETAPAVVQAEKKDLVEEAHEKVVAQAESAPVVEKAAEEKPKKPRKPRAPRKAPAERKPRTTKKAAPEQKTLAEEPARQTGSVSDSLLERVHAFGRSQSGLITNAQIIKKDTELTCVLTVPGPFGNTSFYVAATTKKLAEKQVMTWQLQAKPQGMPLLVLSDDAIGKKLESSFEGQNVNLRRLP